MLYAVVHYLEYICVLGKDRKIQGVRKKLLLQAGYLRSVRLVDRHSLRIGYWPSSEMERLSGLVCHSHFCVSNKPSCMILNMLHTCKLRDPQNIMHNERWLETGCNGSFLSEHFVTYFGKGVRAAHHSDECWVGGTESTGYLSWVFRQCPSPSDLSALQIGLSFYFFWTDLFTLPPCKGAIKTQNTWHSERHVCSNTCRQHELPCSWSHPVQYLIWQVCNKHQPNKEDVTDIHQVTQAQIKNKTPQIPV